MVVRYAKGKPDDIRISNNFRRNPSPLQRLHVPYRREALLYKRYIFIRDYFHRLLIPPSGDFGPAVGTAGILYCVCCDIIADAFDKKLATLVAAGALLL